MKQHRHSSIFSDISNSKFLSISSYNLQRSVLFKLYLGLRIRFINYSNRQRYIYLIMGMAWVKTIELTLHPPMFPIVCVPSMKNLHTISYLFFSSLERAFRSVLFKNTAIAWACFAIKNRQYNKSTTSKFKK